MCESVFLYSWNCVVIWDMSVIFMNMRSSMGNSVLFSIEQMTRVIDTWNKTYRFYSYQLFFFFSTIPIVGYRRQFLGDPGYTSDTHTWPNSSYHLCLSSLLYSSLVPVLCVCENKRPRALFREPEVQRIRSRKCRGIPTLLLRPESSHRNLRNLG